MAINTLSSACNTSSKLSRTLGNTPTCPDFRDASFSSYISNAKAISILKLAEAKQDQSTTIANLQEYQTSSQRRLEDREISIFSAEKYFNGGMDEDSVTVTVKDGEKHHPMKDHQVDPHSIKSKLEPGNMSSDSDPSWNTQSPLVPGFVKYQSPSRKKGMSRRFFLTFNWKCSCSDKRSVDINENVQEENVPRGSKKNVDNGKKLTEAPMHIKTDPINSNDITQNEKRSIPFQSLTLQKDENFAFVVSNSAAANLAAEKQCENKLEQGNKRKSLEVFGSPILHKEDKALSFDSRLTMFTWDINPSNENITATSDSSGTQDDEDSDSSSDLFEIKNLSENAHPFFKRRVSDDMSTSVASTCYEPSEASIDWSVLTVAAANFPMMSNYEEKASKVLVPCTKTTTKTTTAKTVIAEVQRNHPRGVLGSKNQKVAKVAGEAYRELDKAMSNKQQRERTNTLTDVTSKKGNGSRDFKSASAQHSFRLCSVPQWHSAQESQSMSKH